MKINIYKVLHCVYILLLFSYNKGGNVKIFQVVYLLKKINLFILIRG